MPGGEANLRGRPAGADSGMLVREWQWGQTAPATPRIQAWVPIGPGQWEAAQEMQVEDVPPNPQRLFNSRRLLEVPGGSFGTQHLAPCLVVGGQSSPSGRGEQLEEMKDLGEAPMRGMRGEQPAGSSPWRSRKEQC